MRFLDLGPLRVQLEAEPVGAGGKRPAAALSALLLHVNQRVSVDLLLDAVWGEQVSAGSGGTLETHIWRLRRLLEPTRARGQAATVVINDSGGYRLVATPDQVDSVRFEQLSLAVVDLLATDQPDRALQAADAAVALWRGRPFPDIADRPWALGPIGRLEELLAQLQERRVDALLGVGRPDAAVSELEPLLSEHPFRERLWWQRMLALYRSGRVEEALSTYRTARRTLLDEVGLEPGPELAELQRRILDQDPELELRRSVEAATVARPTEVHLPRRRTLIGRQSELERLTGLLPDHRTVTLAGPAGCGKTVLAVETARGLGAHFSDGIWFVDLSATDGDHDLTAEVAAALGLAVPQSSTALAALTSFSRDRRMLLVLDNCEQVLDQAAELVDLLNGQESQTSTIVTSREPLGVADELVLTLGPLPVEPAAGADRVRTDAVALFLDRARLGADGLADADLDAIVQICRVVDGIPLAIELAAALTSTYTLAEIADQVERDPGQLAAIGRGQARHHQTLAAAIDRSYRLLSDDEQLLHRRIAVLPGDFSRGLAEAVVGPDAGRRTSSLLARLVHRSLLGVAHPEGGETRFHQLAPIRAHAWQALSTAGESESTERRRDEWTRDLVRSRPRVGHLEEAAWYAAVAADLPTVRATLNRRLAVEPDPIGIEVSAHLGGFWFYLDLLDEGCRWAELAVVVSSDAPTATPTAYAISRLAYGHLLLLLSRADRAREEIDSGLTLVERRPDGSAGFAVRGAEPLSVVESTLLTELVAAVSVAFASIRDTSSMRRVLDLIASHGLLAADPDLALLDEAGRCMADVIDLPAASMLARVAASFESAERAGQLWAAWYSAASGASIGLSLRDPALGRAWSRRVIDLQGRLGSRTVMQQVETFGDFLALDGHLVEATRIFSATYSQARRIGIAWPRNSITSDMLARSRAGLSTAEFDRAWAIGPTLSRTELTAEPQS